MTKEDPYTVYVSVGHPKSTIPVMDKVAVLVDHINGETPVQAAKKLRKQVADRAEHYGFIQPKIFKPSQLYYEVYGTVESRFPYAESTNSPHLYLGDEE